MSKRIHDKMRDDIYDAIKNLKGAVVEKEVPLGKLPSQKFEFWKDYDLQNDWKGQLDIYLHQPYEIAIEVCGTADVYAKVLRKVLTIKKLRPKIQRIDIFEYDYLDRNSESGQQFELWTGRKARDYTEIQSFVLERWLKEKLLPQNVIVKFKSQQDLEKLKTEGFPALL